MRSPGLPLTAARALFAGISVAHEDAPVDHKTPKDTTKPPAVPPGPKPSNQGTGGCFTLEVEAQKYHYNVSGLLVLSTKEVRPGDYSLIRPSDDPKATPAVFQLIEGGGATVKTKDGSVVLAYHGYPKKADVLVEMGLTPQINRNKAAKVVPNLGTPGGFSFGDNIGTPVVCLSKENYFWLAASKNNNDPRVSNYCIAANITAEKADCTTSTAPSAGSPPGKGKKGSTEQPQPQPPPPKA